jgi:hypothetical protein
MNENTLYHISLDPPWTIIALMVGVVIVVAISMFLKKGDRNKKISGLVILVIALGIVSWFTLKPASLTVTSQGISTTAYGGFKVDFNALAELKLADPLEKSGYEPTIKLNGMAIGSEKSGLFSLARGGNAKVFMRQDDSALILITNAGDTFILAPEEMEPFLEAVEAASPLPISPIPTNQ